MSIEAGQQISIWSVRISVALWFLFAIASLRPRGDHRIPGRIWMMATLLHIVHVILAIGYFHDWSHQLATVHTANRTAELTGVNWSGGIWFNHLFMLVCIVESGLWLFTPNVILERSRRMSLMVYGFWSFMIFNAAVVFVPGWYRWINLTGFGVVILLAIRIHQKSHFDLVKGQRNDDR